MAKTSCSAARLADGQITTTDNRANVDLRGLAHITGGGLPGNVPRALPPGLAARLDPTRWRMPSVMRLFGALGGLDDHELRSTFNGGLGMIAIVPPGDVAAAIASFGEHGVDATVVGEIVDAGTLGGARYVDQQSHGNDSVVWDANSTHARRRKSTSLGGLEIGAVEARHDELSACFDSCEVACDCRCANGSSCNAGPIARHS